MFSFSMPGSFCLHDDFVLFLKNIDDSEASNSMSSGLNHLSGHHGRARRPKKSSSISVHVSFPSREAHERSPWCPPPWSLFL